jgi:type II secretory pathway component PulJ
MNLTDLLVYIAVAGVLLTGTVVLLQQGQHAYALGAARVEVQQNARLALQRLAAEIRAAGFAPGGSSFGAITEAEPTRLTIQSDLDGDGVIAATSERVTYLLRGTTLRRDAGGGAQPVLHGVAELRFTYLDSRHRPAADLDTIRSVGISISARPASPVAPGAPPVVATLATEARLRNR